MSKGDNTHHQFYLFLWCKNWEDLLTLEKDVILFKTLSELYVKYHIQSIIISIYYHAHHINKFNLLLNILYGWFANNIVYSLLLKAKIEKLPHLKKDLSPSHLTIPEVSMSRGNFPVRVGKNSNSNSNSKCRKKMSYSFFCFTLNL